MNRSTEVDERQVLTHAGHMAPCKALPAQQATSPPSAYGTYPFTVGGGVHEWHRTLADKKGLEPAASRWGSPHALRRRGCSQQSGGHVRCCLPEREGVGVAVASGALCGPPRCRTRQVWAGQASRVKQIRCARVPVALPWLPPPVASIRWASAPAECQTVRSMFVVASGDAPDPVG